MFTQIPPSLKIVAWISLSLALLSTLVVVLDILCGHWQKMWIMNLVWPLTALWAGPLGLWAYFRIGRQSAEPAGSQPEKPFWQSSAVAASHCGAGCTLGDLMAESFTVLVPLHLFGSTVFGTWALDFGLTFLFGVAFQYFTIQPMKDLPPGEGLVAALKADTLSLTAWQVGMYGWMAVALFVLFSRELLPKTGPTFWLMMQLAMAAGFLTSYPVNRWLLRRGIKEEM
jgi:hypothetical protein